MSVGYIASYTANYSGTVKYIATTAYVQTLNIKLWFIEQVLNIWHVSYNIALFYE